MLVLGHGVARVRQPGEVLHLAARFMPLSHHAALLLGLHKGGVTQGGADLPRRSRLMLQESAVDDAKTVILVVVPGARVQPAHVYRLLERQRQPAHPGSGRWYTAVAPTRGNTQY